MDNSQNGLFTNSIVYLPKARGFPSSSSVSLLVSFALAHITMIRACVSATTVLSIIISITTNCIGRASGTAIQTELKPDAGDAINQLAIVIKVDGATSFSDSNVIVMKGVTKPQWSPRCGATLLDQCRKRVVDRYTDELVMEFVYINSRDFNFTSPTVQSSHGRARPVVSDFSYDDDGNSGEIIVWHRCDMSEEGHDEMSQINMSFPVRNDATVHLSWVKTCGSGDHDRLDYGYLADRGDTHRKLMELSLKGSTDSTSDVMTFGPRILSTRIYLRLYDGAQSQHFSTPKIRVVDDDERDEVDDTRRRMSVEMRGATYGGVIKGSYETVFDVIYACDGRGTWRVRVDIKIAPFEEVEMEWVKDCGGGAERGVNIANEPYASSADIVRDGAALASYQFGAKDRPQDKKGEYAAVWGRGDGNKIFFLIVDGRAWKAGEGGIGVGEIVAHSEDERVGTARMGRVDEGYSALWAGMKTASENGEVITQQVRRVLRIRVRCLKRGWMRIGVRIAIRDREAVEWWFWNECLSKRGIRHEIYPTAATMMYSSLAVFAIGVLMLLKRGCAAAQRGVVIHSRYKGAACVAGDRGRQIIGMHRA